MELPKFKGYQFGYSATNNKLGFRKGDTVVFSSKGLNTQLKGVVIDVNEDSYYPVVCEFPYGKGNAIKLRFSAIGEYNIRDGVQLMRLFGVGDKVMYFEGDKYWFGDVIATSPETNKISIFTHHFGQEDNTFFEDGTQSWAEDDILRRLHLVSPAPAQL